VSHHFNPHSLYPAQPVLQGEARGGGGRGVQTFVEVKAHTPASTTPAHHRCKCSSRFSYVPEAASLPKGQLRHHQTDSATYKLSGAQASNPAAPATVSQTKELRPATQLPQLQ
jgi:hypothetical protein